MQIWVQIPRAVTDLKCQAGPSSPGAWSSLGSGDETRMGSSWLEKAKRKA